MNGPLHPFRSNLPEAEYHGGTEQFEFFYQKVPASLDLSP